LQYLFGLDKQTIICYTYKQVEQLRNSTRRVICKQGGKTLKTLYQNGNIHVQLDEASGQVSIMQGMLLAKTCKEGIIIQNGALDESAILGQLDGDYGLKVSMHASSWGWFPAEVVRRQ